MITLVRRSGIGVMGTDERVLGSIRLVQVRLDRGRFCVEDAQAVWMTLLNSASQASNPLFNEKGSL